MLVLYLSAIDSSEDRDKFETVYLKYRKMMYITAYSVLNNREDAEDAVQDSFLSLAKNMDRIGDAESKETQGYMYRTAKNTAINIYNRNRKRIELEKTLDENMDEADGNISDSELERLASETDFRRVVECILALPEPYSTVLQMHFRENKTVRKTAAELGLTVSAVKQRLVRGKKMLMKLLESEESE